MAVEQGSLPVHFSEDPGVPDKHNSVIMLEEKIEESFELIGENQNTLFEGRYISILNGPQKTVENPVDGFFEDNDGEYYRTDLNYGNFEDDSYLNAAVARYPENTAEASKLFYRSTESEKWSDTTVASSYLHSNWPVILSTAGGGMRHGSQTEKVLRTETDTVHLVEHRADPVIFLLDLTPVEISGFLSETQEVEDVLAEFVSDNAASSVRNALIVIEVLSYAQQILEMYYEYDWSSYSFDFESSMDRVEDLEVPEDDSLSGVVQKSAVQAVYVFIWPERHSELTETGLVEEMDSDFVYYRGVGDESSWILPNDESGIVDDRYTGENSLESGDIPEVDGVIWDNSDNAGKKDAELKNSFIENGAVAHLGFSSVSYSEYSSVVSYNFLSHGETLGQSMLEGVNSLRSGELVYSPTTAHRSGVREKMSHSLMLEGNPETVKQSFGNNTYSTNHTCSEDLCSLRAEKSPDIEVLETGEEETLVYDADDYLLEPGKPITPLYRFSYPLPVEPEEVREKSVYETRENVELPELELLTHNQVHNEDSIEYTTFPDKRYNSSYSNELSFVQSGIQKDRDRLKVLEKSVVEIDYKPFVTVDLNRTGRTLTAELNSDKAFDSELVYSINGDSYTEEANISEGENSFRLEELSKGSSEVELYVLNSTVLGYGEEQFRISRPINKTLSSENMVRGGRGEVTAYLDNPNSFETSKELALETDNLTQLGFLEDKVKEVTLEGHESETVSWSLTGLEKGSSVLNIENSSTEAEVKPENYINRSEGLSLFRKMVSDRQSFEQKSSSSKVSLLFSSPEGSVEVVKSSEYLEKYLQTSQFSVSVTEEDGKVVRYVERSDGFFKQVLKNGEVRQYNEGVSREEFETYLEKLESETGKIYEWYELGHGFEKSED